MQDIYVTMLLPLIRNVALAIVLVLAGLIVIRKIAEIAGKQVEQSKLDNTLKPFSMSFVSGALKILLVISVISLLGVPTTSFVAVIAAAGFAIEDPAVFVRISEHGDSAVFFTVRAWVNEPDFFAVYFDVMETVKKRFDEEGISIPYPQMDVHMQK